MDLANGWDTILAIFPYGPGLYPPATEAVTGSDRRKCVILPGGVKGTGYLPE